MVVLQHDAALLYAVYTRDVLSGMTVNLTNIFYKKSVCRNCVFPAGLLLPFVFLYFSKFS